MSAFSEMVVAGRGRDSPPGPYLMGILNVTPDSFSDGGAYESAAEAIAAAENMTRTGAHLIDVGGESTAPGSKAVPADVELRRVEQVVRTLAPSTVISIDTYKAKVAARCLALGAKIVNDVSALRADDEMPAVLREFQPFTVLMYSKETRAPHVSEDERHYQDVIAEIRDFLSARIDFAVSHGLAQERIILDPGMGRYISNDPEISWTLLRRLGEFAAYFRDFPLLVGTSRKGFLGGRLAERDPISQLTGLHAALNGAAILRTHNIPMAVEFLSCWRKLEQLG